MVANATLTCRQRSATNKQETPEIFTQQQERVQG